MPPSHVCRYSQRVNPSNGGARLRSRLYRLLRAIPPILRRTHASALTARAVAWRTRLDERAQGQRACCCSTVQDWQGDGSLGFLACLRLGGRERWVGRVGAADPAAAA
jgi:hypothetical protein